MVTRTLWQGGLHSSDCSFVLSEHWGTGHLYLLLGVALHFQHGEYLPHQRKKNHLIRYSEMAITPSLFFRLSSASFWQANHKEYILFFRQVGNIMLNLF